MAEGLRWRLSGDDAGQGRLFDADELLDRHVGTGEFQGIEFLHVNARRIINEVPSSSRMPFRHTINAYRGCSHACCYCMEGSTPILMGDGRVKPLSEIRRGDMVFGTERAGRYRRYVQTPVSDHWSTIKRAYEVNLSDGSRLVTSGDHRFLTDRGWKHVTGEERGSGCRPHLTTRNRMIGTGHFASPPAESDEYRTGYLCGMIRGDGSVGHYRYRDPGRDRFVHRFRLALTDLEPLLRSRRYLASLDVHLSDPVGFKVPAGYAPMSMIRASAKAVVERIEWFREWPLVPSRDWVKGFLAGIFDAEGSYSRGILRISNKDPEILEATLAGFEELDFDVVLERPRTNGVRSVRVRGGLPAHLRFFQTVSPATTRKMDITGMAVKCGSDLRILSVNDLGKDIPMYDITTETGDFIANGVISHNCFARPTHEYLGLNSGHDFETKIVVKINAVERVRAELASPRWPGAPIAMGTNTDPYQRCEGKYHLTRGIVKALSDARNPFSILTKSTLVLRDLDLLAHASRRTSVRLNLSIGTLDEAVWRSTEPGTPHPRQRVNAVRRLTEGGVECGVLVAPVIPGMSDGRGQVREVVEACREAGAVSVTPIGLHLRPGVREHFIGWLAGARPDLVPTYEGLYGRGSYLPKGAQARLAAEADLRAERPREGPGAIRPPNDKRPERG